MSNERPNQLCTFFVDDLLVGVDVTRVQEVICNQHLTSVPLAPPGVAGLINLRGQIVTALDLRWQVGLGARKLGAGSVNVVLRQDRGVVSVVVDEVGDVVDVEDSQFEQAPATLPARLRALMRGVYKLKTGLLVHLDADLMLNADFSPALGVLK